MQSIKLKSKSRIVSWSVLVAVVLSNLGFVALPQPAQAITSVPTETRKDQQSMLQKMINAGVNAVASSAVQKFDNKFNNIIEDKLGVKSFQQYQKALVEAKYLSEAYKSTYSLASSTGSSAKIASDFERMPLNKTMSANQARQLAINDGRKSKAVRDTDIQKLIVGASSLFTSSISCGGVNKKAIQNTTEYLAAASTGFLSKDINPRNAVDFYGKMARLGSPSANPAFWEVQLQQIGAQKEAEAKAAAVLEITAPGLKSPQMRLAGGKLETGKSVDLVGSSRKNSQEALFNIGLKGSDSVYDTSSFKGFIGSVITVEVGQVVNQLMNSFLGFLGIDIGSLRNTASAVAGQVASGWAKNMATKTYDKIANSIFQGVALKESSGCLRSTRPARVRGASSVDALVMGEFDEAEEVIYNDPEVLAFTNSDRNFQGALEEEDQGVQAGEILFDIDFLDIIAGETITLDWDASLVGENVSVTLSGGAISGSKPIVGQATDKPVTTTTYTITATAGNAIKTKSLTVSVADNRSSLNATPLQVERGRMAKISWDVSAIDTTAGIDPLSESDLPSQGQQCSAPLTESTKYILSADSSGNLFTRELDVSVVAPAPRTVVFVSDKQKIQLGQSATLGWNIQGYPDAVFSLDGESVGRSDERIVSPTATTTFSLIIAEENQCAQLDQASVTIGVGKATTSFSASGTIAGVSTLMPRE